MSDPNEGIRWPPEFELSTRPVHVSNDLAMAVPIERVWAWLIRAVCWPTYYDNSKNVRFVEGEPPDLSLGTRFHWRTFSSEVDSRVREFEPRPRIARIAWDAKGFGFTAYHAWLMRETPEGCHVLTEERQHGWAAKLQSVVCPRRMWWGHKNWLESLQKKAAEGWPPKDWTTTCGQRLSE